MYCRNLDLTNAIRIHNAIYEPGNPGIYGRRIHYMTYLFGKYYQAAVYIEAPFFSLNENPQGKSRFSSLHFMSLSLQSDWIQP